MEKFSVDIVSYNDEKDKFDNCTFYCNNMKDVCSLLLTHKFKKGYYLVNVNINRIETLV